MVGDLSSKEKLPDWLRRWYALKGELRFREAADEIERLSQDLARTESARVAILAENTHYKQQAKESDAAARQWRTMYERRLAHEPCALPTPVITTAGVVEVADSGPPFECVLRFNTYEEAVDAQKFVSRTCARTAQPPEVTLPAQADVLDWAVRSFGPIAQNVDERAARVAEEAIEIAQVEGVPLETIKRIADRVYSRPAGERWQEIGGTMIGMLSYAEIIGLSLAECTQREFQRVLSKPREWWQKKHAEKVAAGTADLSPAGAPPTKSVLGPGNHALSGDTVASQGGPRFTGPYGGDCTLCGHIYDAHGDHALECPAPETSGDRS